MKYIKLPHNKRTKVDDEDFGWLSSYKWTAQPHGGKWRVTGNIQTTEGKRTTFMSRLIMNCPDGKMVDHANGNSLDNQRANLRICTDSQNLMNSKKPTRPNLTSKFKGVSYIADHPRKKNWRAMIMLNGKRYFLGMFATEEDAAKAYDDKANEMFKEFAKPNFRKIEYDKGYADGFRDAQMGQTGLNEKAYTKLMAEIDNEKTGLKVACLRIDCSDAQQHVKECVAYGKPYPRQTGLEGKFVGITSSGHGVKDIESNKVKLESGKKYEFTVGQTGLKNKLIEDEIFEKG